MKKLHILTALFMVSFLFVFPKQSFTDEVVYPWDTYEIIGPATPHNCLTLEEWRELEEFA